MTGEQALNALLDVSEDVVAALLVGAEGEALASTVDDAKAAEAAGIAAAMLAYADTLRSNADATRLEAHVPEGSVFVVRDAERAAVALTTPEPVSGLVLHDLRTVLGQTRARGKAKARA